MRTRAFLILAVLALLAPALALAGPADDIDGITSWRARFRDYAIERVDPAALRADAADGAVDLTLRGVTYPLSLSPVPWDPSPPITTDGPLGAIVRVEREVETVAYVGTLAGVPESHVLLVITAMGADGFIRTGEGVLKWEPLVFYDRLASRDEVLVYDVSDYLFTLDLTQDGGDELPPAELREPPLEPGVRHAVNPSLLVVADSYFVSAWGVSVDARIDTVMNHASDTFWYEFGWWWSIDQIKKCGATDTSCSNGWGSNTNDPVTLRNNFGNAAKAKRGTGDIIWFEAAHLLTGRDMTGTTDGIAFLAGRYSVSQHTGSHGDWYGGQLVAHELGHTVAGTHPSATSWTTTGYRSYYHCHSYFFGYCTNNHYHENEAYTITHYSVMHGSAGHNGFDVIWEQDFSSGNNANIAACNDGTWDVYLTFDAVSQSCT